MATDPLQSGPFGVADPFDFTRIAPTPQTSAESIQGATTTPVVAPDPFDFTGAPSTPYVPPTVPNIYPVAADPTAIEQVDVWTPGRPVSKPWDIDTRTVDPDDSTDEPDDGDDGDDGDTSWTENLAQGLIYDAETRQLTLDPDAPGGLWDIWHSQGYNDLGGEYTWGERGSGFANLGGGWRLERYEGPPDQDDDPVYMFRIVAPEAATAAATTATPAAATTATTATTPAATTPAAATTATPPAATTPAEWMNRLPQGMRYSGGRLEIDPTYSTSGSGHGWSYDDSSERDVFNRNAYLGAMYERMYGRRRGDIPALGGGYGISREAISSDDAADYNRYSITGPNMAAGGVVRRPSYLSGGLGSLGSTYLR